MTNYYNALGLSAQAGRDEIKIAIDGRYNQYRALVTHPDPDIRAEAERSLRLLEQMRGTLTDPTKRAAYDEGVGLIGAGGLADPEALLQRAAPPKPKPISTETGTTTTDLWTCPKCDTRNPEWTQYCLNCQHELVRVCPECGQIRSLVKTGVCGNCGIAHKVALQRIELKTFIVANSSEIDQHQAQLTFLEGKRASVPQTRSAQLVLIALGILLAISVVGVLIDGQVIAALVGFMISTILLLFVNYLIRYEARRSNRMIGDLNEQIKSQQNKLRLLQEQQQEAIDTYQRLVVRRAV